MSDDVQAKPQESVPVQTTPSQPSASRAIGPFEWLRHEVDQLIDDFGQRQGRLFDWPEIGFPHMPSVDLDDCGKEFRLTAELPGFEPNEVKLELQDGSLRISALHEEKKEERSEQALLRERRRGRVERLVPLPQAVDAVASKASMQNGVLNVTLPKLPPVQPASQRIAITS